MAFIYQYPLNIRKARKNEGGKLGAGQLMGYTEHYTIDELIAALGRPTFGPNKGVQGDGKVSVEWDLVVNGTRVRVYDWKSCGHNGRTSKQAQQFHIGGNSGDAVEAIRAMSNLRAYGIGR